MSSRFAHAIGTEHPEVSATVDRARLTFFARVIGETDPVYTDLDAARAAGHPDIPVPPTFLFGLIGEAAGGLDWLTRLDVDTGNLLHGEQHFTYHRVPCAGETLTMKPRISDAYSKKDGELEFLVRDTPVQGEDGTRVAELRDTLVVRFDRSAS